MQGRPGFGGLLVDKAKRTGIRTLNEAIKQGCFKLQPQIIIPVFFQLNLMSFTRRIDHIEDEIFARDRELVVNQIARRHTIDGH